MSGNYPSDATITTLAGQLNANPSSVFAYVADNQGQLPTSPGILQAYVTTTTASATSWGVDVRLLYGYITQYGGLGSHQQLIDWARTNNYMDASGNVVYYPAAGQNFIGDISVTNPNPTGAPNPNAPPSQTTGPNGPLGIPFPDFTGLTQSKPLLFGVGALAVLYVLNPRHWRGR